MIYAVSIRQKPGPDYQSSCIDFKSMQTVMYMLQLKFRAQEHLGRNDLIKFEIKLKNTIRIYVLDYQIFQRKI